MDKMDKLIDWVKSLPKPIQLLLILLFAGGLGFAVFATTFGGVGKAEAKTEAQPESVAITMPDPAQERNGVSDKIAALMKGSSSSADEYWNDLQQKEDSGDEQFSLLPAEKTKAVVEDDLDPSVYSDYERRAIRSGYKTRAEIDAEHAAAAAKAKEKASTPPPAPALTQAQQDSIYFARIERAYGIVNSMSQQGQQPAEEVKEPEEEEPRHIEVVGKGGTVEASYIETDSFGGDGIITSLDEPSSGGVIHYSDAKVRIVPVKATFLRSEHLSNGQRVIIRIMQDMMLSDGTVVPANTHLTGTCEFGKRLRIKVSSVHCGGKMIHTDLSIYDNDGTEGIYCPKAEARNGRDKSTKRVASSAVSGVANAATSMFTGNPYLGRVAQSSINEARTVINSDGSVSVSVLSGYEFYVMENINME